MGLMLCQWPTILGISLFRSNDIHTKLDGNAMSSFFSDYSTSRSVEVSLSEFNTLSMEDVMIIISRSAKKTSCLDPMPTSLVLQCSDELLPVITTIINLSLESGQFANEWKEAIATTPLLKKCETDLLFKNLRPVSNLAYISELTETAVAVQLQSHLTRYGLHPVFQSVRTDSITAQERLCQNSAMTFS